VAPLRTLFEWVQAFPSSIAIRESLDLYSWILVSHVVSMSTFGGLVLKRIRVEEGALRRAVR